MKKLILLYIFLLITASIIGQKRIHLAHGLSGTIDSWGNMEEEINDVCNDVLTSNGTYNSTDGIDAYVADFILEQAGLASSQDIAISHSFGGLALRRMEEQNLGMFGGYITVAGPHSGALLANSVTNGQLESYLENGCSQVVGVPVAVVTNIVQILNVAGFLNVAGLINLIVDSVIDPPSVSAVLCDGLYEDLLENEAIIDGFFGASGVSITELEVGGAGSLLPPSTLPSVAITGEAASPVHWNLIQEGIINREGVDPSLVAALNGTPIPQIMKSAELGMYGLSDFFLSVSNILAPKWYNPGTWATGGLSTMFLDGYIEVSEGANWLETSEEGWTEIIGAGGGFTTIEVPIVVDVPFQKCTSDADCYNGDVSQGEKLCLGGQCVDMNGDPCGDSNITTTIMVQRIIPNPSLPSDGVVTVASQQLPGALRSRPVDNVTHFGEQNNGDVWEKISVQFQVGAGLPGVFRIEGCSF